MPFSDVIGHERVKALLRAAILHDRVAHAYLFFGEPRIGKRLVGVRFAQAINCDTEYGHDDPDACGVCRSCRQTETFAHPDVLCIQPDQERATPQIKIEQIREIEQSIIYRPLIGRRKVCLIDDADCMTLSAANALLKTLEEPPAHSLFLLITSRPSALPATVRSRCQALRFAPPARTQVEAALIVTREVPPNEARLLASLTEARIGEALTLDLETVDEKRAEFEHLTSFETLRSIPQLLTAAESLAKADRAPEALEWIARWIRDLVLQRIGADPSHTFLHSLSAELTHVASRTSIDSLLNLLDAIEMYQRSSTRNLNPHLALESILIRLRETVGVEVNSLDGR